MTTFNFTVRAEDDQGAFSDREFSIKVRNTMVDRYMLVDATDAYTSVDMVTWTKRALNGGQTVVRGGNTWFITQVQSRAIGGTPLQYRTSTDGVNFTNRTLNKNVVGHYEPVYVGDLWFVIVNNGNSTYSLWSSANAIDWEVHPGSSSFPATTNYSPFLSVGDGNILIVSWGEMSASNNGTFANPLYSTDMGTTWKTYTASKPGYSSAASTLFRFVSLSIVNGLWYLCYSAAANTGTNGACQLWYSIDGITGVVCNVPTVTSTNYGLISGVGYVNGVFYLKKIKSIYSTTMTCRGFVSSRDGKQFAHTDTGPASQSQSFSYTVAKGRIFVVAGFIAQSSNLGSTFGPVTETMPTATPLGFAKIG